MKVLVICRLAPGIAAQEISARAKEEITALNELRREGRLVEAYSPGGPGAILICAGERAEIEHAIAGLPLVRDAIITTELIELHAIPGFDPI